MPRHWDPLNRPHIVIARSPSLSLSDGGHMTGSTGNSPAVPGEQPTSIVTSVPEEEHSPAVNSGSRVEEVVIATSGISEPPPADDDDAFGASLHSSASSVGCHCGSVDLCTCGKGGPAAAGERYHRTSSIERGAAVKKGNAIRPYNAARPDSEDEDENTDSLESHCGSLDEETRNHALFEIEELEQTATTGDATEMLSPLKAAPTAEDIDDELADQVIKRASKIHGIRLRYMFIVSLVIALCVFGVLFIFINREYADTIQLSGEVVTVQTALRWSEKVIEAMGEFSATANTGLLAYQHLEKFVELGDYAAARATNETMQSVLCNSALGVQGFAVVDHDYQHSTSEVSFDNNVTNATTMTTTMTTTTTSQLGRLEGGHCRIVDFACSKNTFGSAGSSEGEMSSSPRVNSQEEATEAGGDGRAVTLSLRPARELCHNEEVDDDKVYVHGRPDFSLFSATEDVVRWAVQTANPNITVTFTMLRSMMQRYFFRTDHAMAYHTDLPASNGIEVSSAWFTNARLSSAKSGTDRSGSTVSSDESTSEGSSTVSTPANTNGGGNGEEELEYKLLFSSTSDGLPSKQETAEKLSLFARFCANGKSSTWHYPFSVNSEGRVANDLEYELANMPPVHVVNWDPEDGSKENWPSYYTMCVTFCTVENVTAQRECNISDPTQEFITVMINANLHRLSRGHLLQVINAAGWSTFAVFVLFNLFFHVSISIPSTYIHKRIVGSLTGKRRRPTKRQRFIFRVTRPLWVGELKSILSAFTVMSSFFSETRKHMPEHLRRQQLLRLRDAELLEDLLQDEAEKERDVLRETSSSYSSTLPSGTATTGGAGREGTSAFSQALESQAEGQEAHHHHHHHHEGEEEMEIQIPVLTQSALMRHVSFTNQNLMKGANVDFGASSTEFKQNLGLEVKEPKTPTMPFRFNKQSPGKGRGESNLSNIDLVTVLVIHIGYIEAAFNLDFQAAERQHKQIIGTLLAIFRKWRGEIFTRRGESIGVCWNAFESVANHVYLGVRCARDIATVFETVKSQGLSIGVGLSAGPVIAGTIGDEGFIMNVAFGETINKAFSIAELGKQLPCASLLITESVKQFIGNRYECVIVDVVKTSEGTNYEPLFDITGEKKASASSPLDRRGSRAPGGKKKPKPRDFAVEYNTAFTQFRQHKFSQALSTIASIQREFGENRLSVRLKTICQFCERSSANAKLLPNPYHRVYPEWQLYEREVAKAMLRIVQDDEEIAEASASFHEFIHRPEKSSEGLTTLNFPSDLTKDASASPIFKESGGDERTEMEAFRKDLDHAVTQVKAGKMRPASTLLPAAQTPKFPTGGSQPQPSAPVNNSNLLLEDSLFDMRATNYQESAFGHSVSSCGAAQSGGAVQGSSSMVSPRGSPQPSTYSPVREEVGSFPLPREQSSMVDVSEIEAVEAVEAVQEEVHLVDEGVGSQPIALLEPTIVEGGGGEANREEVSTKTTAAAGAAAGARGTPMTTANVQAINIPGLQGSVLRQGTLHGSLVGEVQLVMDSTELSTTIETHRGTVYTRSSNVLGTGSYGCVYLGMEQHTGRFIAMKFLPLPVEETEREHIVNEVQIMQTVRDAHIVDFYDFAIVGGRIVLMMECVVPGSLSSMLKNFASLSTVTVVHFMRDILKGLNKLHSRGIMHRDVKPQNVLITSTGVCKLSDFGASASLGEFVRREAVGVVVGTPLYMAPEAARGEGTQLSDIWSVGIMFLELTTGHVPYEMSPELHANPALFVYRIGSGALRPEYNEEDFSSLTLDFLKGCLQWEAAARSSAADLLALPFFNV